MSNKICFLANSKLDGLLMEKTTPSIGRKEYFTHMIVFFLYSLIFKEVTYFGWDAFLVSIIAPILFTPLILRHEERFPILKELFG